MQRDMEGVEWRAWFWRGLREPQYVPATVIWTRRHFGRDTNRKVPAHMMWTNEKSAGKTCCFQRRHNERRTMTRHFKRQEIRGQPWSLILREIQRWSDQADRRFIQSNQIIWNQTVPKFFLSVRLYTSSSWFCEAHETTANMCMALDGYTENDNNFNALKNAPFIPLP